jgi:hypothetical protein
MVTSRIWFTAAQKAELWKRWKNGQSAASISRALERKNKTGVERIVVLKGGIVPAPRLRALALPERCRRHRVEMPRTTDYRLTTPAKLLGGALTRERPTPGSHSPHQLVVNPRQLNRVFDL